MQRLGEKANFETNCIFLGGLLTSSCSPALPQIWSGIEVPPWFMASWPQVICRSAAPQIGNKRGNQKNWRGPHALKVLLTNYRTILKRIRWISKGQGLNKSRDSVANWARTQSSNILYYIFELICNKSIYGQHNWKWGEHLSMVSAIQLKSLRWSQRRVEVWQSLSSTTCPFAFHCNHKVYKHIRAG